MHNIKKFLNRYRNNGKNDNGIYDDDNGFSAFKDRRIINSDNTLTRRKMNNFTMYNAANYNNLQYNVEGEIADNKFTTTNAVANTTTATSTIAITQNQSRVPQYKNINMIKEEDTQPSSRLRSATIDDFRKKSTPISIVIPPPPPDHPPVPYNKPKPSKYQQFDDLYNKVNKSSKISTTTTNTSISGNVTTNNKKITNKPTMTKYQIISPMPKYDVKNKENDYIHLDGFYYKEYDMVTDLDEVDDFNVKECDRMGSCSLTDICTSLNCRCYESNYGNDIINGLSKLCANNEVLIMFHDGIRFRVKTIKRKDFFRR